MDRPGPSQRSALPVLLLSFPVKPEVFVDRYDYRKGNQDKRYPGTAGAGSLKGKENRTMPAALTASVKRK